jgi:aromatic ring-cleaving dioxygenase
MTTKEQTHREKNKQANKKMLNQLWIINFKHKSLKISLHLQTASATETHRAEGQWLEEQLNIQRYVCSEQELFLELRVEHLVTL